MEHHKILNLLNGPNNVEFVIKKMEHCQYSNAN